MEETLQQSDKIQKSLELTQEIKGCVNGEKSALLRQLAEALRDKATLSKKPEDSRAAEEAEKILEKHLASQPKPVDGGK